MGHAHKKTPKLEEDLRGEKGFQWKKEGDERQQLEMKITKIQEIRV